LEEAVFWGVLRLVEKKSKRSRFRNRKNAASANDLGEAEEDIWNGKWKMICVETYEGLRICYRVRVFGSNLDSSMELWESGSEIY
jgi:hypothetical protein